MNPNISPSYKPNLLATTAATIAATMASGYLGGPAIHFGSEHNTHSTEQVSTAPHAPLIEYQRIEIDETTTMRIGPMNMPFAPRFSASPEAHEVNQDDVTRVVRNLGGLTGNLLIRLDSSASDETAADPDGGLGAADPDNEKLAATRGQAFIGLLNADLAKMHLPAGEHITVTLKSQEDVLSKTRITEIDNMAHKDGLTRRQLLNAYDENAPLPKDAQAFLDTTLGDARGVTAEITGNHTEIVTKPYKVYLPMPAPLTETLNKPDGWGGDVPLPIVVPIYRRKEDETGANKTQLNVPTLFLGHTVVPSTELVPFVQSSASSKELVVYRRDHNFIPVALPALAIEAAPERLAIEAAPPVLAITAARQPRAIMPAPRRKELANPASPDVLPE